VAFFPRFSLFSENLLAVISCPFICAFIPLHTKRGERGKMQKENPQNHPPKKKNQIDQKWGGDSGRCIGILGDFQVGGANMPMCVWSLSLCTFMYSECRAFMY